MPIGRRVASEAPCARAHEIGPDAVISRSQLTRSSWGGGARHSRPARNGDAVAKQSVRPHYVWSATPTRSEPGTFKDRVIMEEDPFAVIEAMAIAAFATGCRTRDLSYLRGEYPFAAHSPPNTRSIRPPHMA